MLSREEISFRVLPVGRVRGGWSFFTRDRLKMEEEISPKASLCATHAPALPLRILTLLLMALFAYNDKEVMPYSKDAEADFFQEFLSHPRSAGM